MEKDRRIYAAVMMGGVSTEREVSLHSGQGVAQALRAAGFDVFEAVVDDESLASIEGLEVDVAFVVLHGKFGEDGGIQRLLEKAGVPYVGSPPEASRDAMDKVATKRIFARSGVPAPAYVVLEDVPGTDGEDRIFAEFGEKVVVKPSAQGSSIGVSIVGREGLAPAVVESLRYDGRVIVEPYIKGRELTVGVIGDRALEIIELRPHRDFFDYVAKYQYGETDYIVRPNLPDALAGMVRQVALDAFKCLGCRDIARVDMMLSEDDEIFVLEANTLPGFTETSLVPMAAAAEGVDFPALCRELVEMALERAGVPRPI